ncbi:gamma-glutamyl-gamma-aminobutyrate hydrolase family protein [Streptomyces niveus]
MRPWREVFTTENIRVKEYVAPVALLRRALEAEVPVLGICLGAQLLAVAAGGDAYAGSGKQVGWGRVGLSTEADRDPLFAGLPASPGVLHWHDDTMSLPAGAVTLASCARYPVQAFRAGSSAWGLQFHLEADEEAVGAFVDAFPSDAASAPGGGRGIREAAPARLAELAPYRDQLFARFAELAAARAGHTAIRAFFTPRAGTWEARFAEDQPAYARAVGRMGLRPGQTAADVGCGTGRALPALREAVGARGAVFGVDLTAAMLRSAAHEHRDDAAMGATHVLPGWFVLDRHIVAAQDGATEIEENTARALDQVLAQFSAALGRDVLLRAVS